MKLDDLIDETARQMTAVNERPALRARVMDALEPAPRPRLAWQVPLVAAGVTASLLLIWTLLPPVSMTDEDDAAAAVTFVKSAAPPRIAPVAGNVEPATIGDESPDTTPRPTVRSAKAMPVIAGARFDVANATAITMTADSHEELTTVATWLEGEPMSIRTLPPLAGPPPIVIQPIVLDDVTMAPVRVEAIEVKRLIVEPLVPAGRDAPVHHGT